MVFIEILLGIFIEQSWQKEQTKKEMLVPLGVHQQDAHPTVARGGQQEEILFEC